VDDAGLTQALEVRRARPDELAECAELYVRVLLETFTWLPRNRHRKADFLAAARDEEIYVAVQDGRIVGLAGFYRPQNFLHSLYVDERGRGVGKALLDHVSAVADGPVSLKVQEPNRRAQAFYDREGFVCTGMGRDPGADVSWRRLERAKRSET
jgi:GNAT superfamily N-acetyltransferase